MPNFMTSPYLLFLKVNARTRAPGRLGATRHLAIQPQSGRPTTVVKSEIGGIVLYIRLPRTGDHDRIRVHIVLLFGGIALNVEDDFLAHLQVLGAPLLLEHGRDRGVVDMAQIVR